MFAFVIAAVAVGVVPQEIAVRVNTPRCELGVRVPDALVRALPGVAIVEADRASSSRVRFTLSVAVANARAIRAKLFDERGEVAFAREVPIMGGACTAVADGVAVIVARHLRDLGWKPRETSRPELAHAAGGHRAATLARADASIGSQSASDAKSARATSDANASRSTSDADSSRSTSDANDSRSTSDAHASRSTSDADASRSAGDADSSRSTSDASSARSTSEANGSRSTGDADSSRSASEASSARASSDANGNASNDAHASNDARTSGDANAASAPADAERAANARDPSRLAGEARGLDLHVDAGLLAYYALDNTLGGELRARITRGLLEASLVASIAPSPLTEDITRPGRARPIGTIAYASWSLRASVGACLPFAALKTCAAVDAGAETFNANVTNDERIFQQTGPQTVTRPVVQATARLEWALATRVSLFATAGFRYRPIPAELVIEDAATKVVPTQVSPTFGAGAFFQIF